jgi:hypothetical protein
MREHSLRRVLVTASEPSDRARPEAGGGRCASRLRANPCRCRCRFACRSGDGSDADSVSVRVADRVFVRVAGRARPRAAPSFGSGLSGRLGLPSRAVWASADEFRDFPKPSHGAPRHFSAPKNDSRPAEISRLAAPGIFGRVARAAGNTARVSGPTF